MPQGKLKVKTKLPAKTKSKKKKSVKGAAVTKRASRPVTPKKPKQEEAQKLKKAITKTVNEAIEDDLRAKALDGKKSLTSSKKKAASGRSKKKT